MYTSDIFGLCFLRTFLTKKMHKIKTYVLKNAKLDMD